MPTVLDSLRLLADADLVARVRSLVARERGATTELVAHLAELDTRDLHLKAGYSSLFVYCRDALALSEHEAYNRIETARAARRFPAILELLAEGAVNLTTVRLLAPHLTAENHRSVLESARGKRKAQVEEIVARLQPWPDVPPSIRKLPPPRPVVVSPGPGCSSPPPGAGSPPVHAPLAGPAAPGLAAPPASTSAPQVLPPRPAVVVPLAPDRYKVQLTISGGTLEKLNLAKDMLRHAIPTGDDAMVFERALTALLADLARSKFAATDQPRPGRGPAPGSRHIPADVKRAVWLRDLGRCAFVGTDSRRCGERGFVEFHHLTPFAAGGEATVENIQLRCRRHNDYEARAYFDLNGPQGHGGFVREAAAPYGPRSSAPAEHRLVPERVRRGIPGGGARVASTGRLQPKAREG